MQRVHFMVSGHVQGVFYRASAVGEAESLGLTGWVQNLPDGRVEGAAEGPREKLEAFIAWCGRGPATARVDAVETDWAAATGEFSGFATRH